MIPATISDQLALAKELASSNLLPDQYRQKPANLIWAIQYAQALNVHPMTAITGISVINGRPTASAQLIGGLVRRAGHKLRVESTDTRATAIIIRADDPSFEFRVEWTMDRARKAGLGGRGPWQQYPAAMLAARAITEVARMAAPECLFGVIYTPEELGAEVDDEGQIVQAAATRGANVALAATTHVEGVKDKHAHEPGTVEVEHTENGEEYVIAYVDHIAPRPSSIYDVEPAAEVPAAEKRIARNQITRIAILRKELGIDDDVYRRRLQSLYGKTSSKELTQDEAADLIQKLTDAKARGAADAAAS